MAPSVPLLRTWRSTICAPSSRELASVVERAIESPASINNRLSQQQHYENSLSDLRKRIVRKASAFSLRSKNRQSEKYLRDLGRQEGGSETEFVETAKQGESKVQQFGPQAIGVSLEITAPNPASLESVTIAAVKGKQLTRKAPQPARREHTSVSMSSEFSAPPIPFKRLQEIATEACDKTLEPATGYVHASTAVWNTTIINSILQKLVKDTTSDSQPQPAYKYIVNSTIIQHAPGGDGGRRGMHAASGAYWNNEKDGMWSFKYEAAEGKGLDVVVGIVWVWIG